MSMKCAHCGGRHTRIETVRQCAAEAGKAVAQPTVVATLYRTPIPVVPTRRHPDLPPVGNYWISSDITVHIRIPANGRWEGRYFVNACTTDGVQEKSMFDKAEREEFLTWLMLNDWQKMMRDYGIHTGFCPACGNQMDSGEYRMGFHDALGPHGDACAQSVRGIYVIQDQGE